MAIFIVSSVDGVVCSLPTPAGIYPLFLLFFRPLTTWNISNKNIIASVELIYSCSKHKSHIYKISLEAGYFKVKIPDEVSAVDRLP